MGLQDDKQSEKENGEKVEKEKKDELEQKKGKLPGLFGEVAIYLSRNCQHFVQNQVRSLIVLAVPLFLSSASWVC